MNMFCVNAEVQGTFNQGHPKFGETAGVQCACKFVGLKLGKLINGQQVILIIS